MGKLEVTHLFKNSCSLFSKVHDLVTNSDNVECHFETHNKEVKKVAHKASSSNKDGLRI